ncbi:alpha/beta hydrolase [Croceibacterium sp. LX-88]|uniref:Alpha/beta hydrolase n=1 Tax=Croceibacterium selenioxidans TaxID=2838833 RepID=A0ABS5W7V4_9SPHN|nr:alpha/beta hydrolase [Croceibacterium selenioxidans]MBT2135734.1 alpha/beta hydrolase [Croceibacterium selenioxidans]
MSRQICWLAIFVAGLFAGAPAMAKVEPFPSTFETRDIAVDGTTIHTRIGGHGPVVLLLHGFGDTGDMWAPLAGRLAADHTVVVPDLRGMGLSSHPETGYDKKSEAGDMAAVLRALGLDGPLALVTHDIGNMVGYAFAAQNRDRVTRWVVMDAPLPGLGNWDTVIKDQRTWHFDFFGPDEERLVAGRERIYLDRFYNELSADPKHIDEETRAHYAALYSRPHAIHNAFAQFAAFRQDAVDNQTFLAEGKLAMPILAIGGEKSFGEGFANEIAFAATDVRGLSIRDSGHWLMEEQPEATMSAILAFITEPASSGQ